MENKSINNFVNNVRLLGKSVSTAKQYKSILEEFVDFFEKNYFKLSVERFKDVELNHIQAFMIYLTDKKKNQPVSIRKKITVIKSFFQYLKANKIIKENPTEFLGSIKVNKKIPKYFTIEECKKILSNINKRNKDRDTAIIKLFLSTGLRLSELVDLNVEDINNNSLTIVGKGNKERTVYLSQEIQAALQEYLKTKKTTKTNALFITENGDRMTRLTIQCMVKNILNRSKIEGSTHKLRHTFATLLYQNHIADIPKIQKMLGHSNISTTMVYVTVDDNELQDVAENNPINFLI